MFKNCTPFIRLKPINPTHHPNLSIPVSIQRTTPPTPLVVDDIMYRVTFDACGCNKPDCHNAFFKILSISGDKLIHRLTFEDTLILTMDLEFFFNIYQQTRIFTRRYIF